MLSDSLHTTSLYKDASFPYVMFTIDHKNCTPTGPGYRYLHWHEELQYTLVTKGTLSIQVNGVLYHLYCGDAIFINCDLLHMTKALSSNGEYVSFNFSPKMLSIFNGSLLEQDYVIPYITDYHYPVLLLSSKIKEHQKTLNILHEMKDANNQLEEYGIRYHLCTLLTTLWFETIRLFDHTCVKSNKVVTKKQEYLHIMLFFIHQHYTLELSLEDIAGSAHISVSECYRCFKSILHVTPYGYLLSFRITKSTELLVETNYSVTEIANMIGFNDSSHFIQYFKKIQKQTPNQYKKMCKDRSASS